MIWFFLTVHLQTTATEIRRVRLLRISFFVYLDKSVSLHCTLLKKISMLESLFNKVTRLMACNFIKKKTPTQVSSCEYHKIFDKSFFFVEHLECLKMAKEFLRISKGRLTRNHLFDPTNLNV